MVYTVAYAVEFDIDLGAPAYCLLCNNHLPQVTSTGMLPATNSQTTLWHRLNQVTMSIAC